jgi:hypothetical protein
MEWQLIDTAPKDGSRILCSWRGDPGSARFLRWKTNHRIIAWNKSGANPDGLLESYFGDPDEHDDYELAAPEKGPTHCLLLPDVPA